MYYRCQYCGGVGTHAKCRVDDATGPFSCRDCTEKLSQGIQLSLPNNSKSIVDEVNDSTASPCKPKHKFDAEGEGKVWKMDHVRDSFKTVTVDLMNPDDEPDSDKAQQNWDFREDRLNRFFAGADFSSKPQPPPWLI